MTMIVCRYKSIIPMKNLCDENYYNEKNFIDIFVEGLDRATKKAKEMGHKVVSIILSYPTLYRRFGFKCCKEYKVKYNGKYLLCCSFFLH